MDHQSIAAVVRGIAPIIHAELNGMRAHFTEQFDEIRLRMQALEEFRPLKGDKGEPGRDGIDGKAVDMHEVRIAIIDAVADTLLSVQFDAKLSDAVAKLPPPEKGEKGEPGERGLMGPQGIQGENGKDGVAGKDGADGKDGKDGADGRDGIDGKDGESGPEGAVGKDGVDGKEGPVGPQGAPGKDGEPGPQGPQGLQGERGLDGANGKDGPPGPQGEKGQDGRDGFAGRDGLPGVQGEKGRDGSDGKDGRDGKDALGIDDLTEELVDDGRELLRQYWRDGAVVKEYRHRTKAMLYRGVWRVKEYFAGDVTTHGGSCWVALRDTSGKPEISPDWQLATKRGHHGKDGKNGRDGERGPAGKDGKNHWDA